MEERIKEVLASFNVIDVRPFNKGWSDDDKYIVITESGEKASFKVIRSFKCRAM